MLGCAGANLTVHEGEISVLMGLSGSGKSTLLRAVNLLNVPARGNVFVKAGDKTVDVASCDADTLRGIRQRQVAMVFQQFALLPWRTVEQNVGLGLELAGMPDAERKQKVDRQLKLVGLDQWAKKYAHELSGGMQQRVGLARAFATEAPILLMDEPFSALDPLIRTKLQDELLQLQATLKKTIIFVSHDLEEALKIGNNITIMEGGRIVQTGAPEDIVLRPANDYVRDFIANVNPLSVLTAWNVMRDRRDLEPAGDGWVWLDRRKTTRFKIDGQGLVTAAERDGKPSVWVSCDDVEDAPDDAPTCVLGAARHVAEDRDARHAPLADLAGGAVRRSVAFRRLDRRQGCAISGVEKVGLRHPAMTEGFDLDRFVRAQAPVMAQVRAELKAGRKATHWMWFVFPADLGSRPQPSAQLYAIASLDEAIGLSGASGAWTSPRRMHRPGQRGRRPDGSRNLRQPRRHEVPFVDDAVFAGRPDEPAFGAALEKYFEGRGDRRTLELLGMSP